MSIRHIANGVTALLLLLCGLLVMVIVKQWENYPPTLPDGELTPNGTETQKESSNNLFRGQHKTIQISQFSEILARPLFTEGRLPDEEEVVDSTGTQPVGQPKIKLEGVAISPDSRVAVIRDLTNNELIRLAEGMIHSGWRLIEVNQVEAVFQHDEETFNLPLELINKPSTKASTSRFRLPNNQPPSRARKDLTK